MAKKFKGLGNADYGVAWNNPAMLKIKYFASLRERLDSGGESLPMPEGVSTIGDLRAHLATRGSEWTRLAAMSNLRCARNQTMADDTATLADGDEIAFFPPVTGG